MDALAFEPCLNTTDRWVPAYRWRANSLSTSRTKHADFLTPHWFFRNSIMNFIVTSPDGTVVQRSVECTSEVKSGEYIAEKLQEVIEDIGPHNVVQVATDSAGNCKKAKAIIAALYPWITVVPCGPHCLDLCMKDIAATEHFKKVDSSVRTVVTYVRAHTRLRREFEDINKKCLQLPGNTRFKGKAIMMSAANDGRSALQQLVFTEPFKDLLNANKADTRAAAEECKKFIMDDELWQHSKGIVQISEPICELLDFCNGEVSLC